MSECFIGEVRLVGFNFAPVGWATCDGSLVPIDQNPALFNLIGTIYGGDGQSTFGLPDLRGRIPIHQGTLVGGSNYVIGEVAGTEAVTLTNNQTPAHNHTLMASSTAASANAPANTTVGNIEIYALRAPNTPMNAKMVGIDSGGNQPHDNMQPYAVLNWIIAMEGIYPSQS